ncbi:MAG: flavodoxin family protein [Verrucomicrobiae bacterium]|nr:flavodoxin family protein [Verrucomicrobiae bacterium]
MKKTFDRRKFIAAASVTAAAAALPGVGAAEAGAAPLKIIGVACSPRRGMTTAKAVQAALEGARAVDARIQTELVDLGGLQVNGHSPSPRKDDLTPLLPKFQDPAFGGLIIGSPSYFRSMSALCKAFIERCYALRDPKNVFANKPVGVVAVAGNRNGGQELIIQQIHGAMLSFNMLVVGGNSPAYLGGTLMAAKDEISGDEVGLDSARKTGAHVAQVVLRLAGLAAA